MNRRNQPLLTGMKLMNIQQKLLLALAIAFSLSSLSVAADRPNILLIVSDDQGYNDLGILGNGIITPALDRIARGHCPGRRGRGGR